MDDAKLWHVAYYIAHVYIIYQILFHIIHIFSWSMSHSQMITSININTHFGQYINCLMHTQSNICGCVVMCAIIYKHIHNSDHVPLYIIWHDIYVDSKFISFDKLSHIWWLLAFCHRGEIEACASFLNYCMCTDKPCLLSISYNKKLFLSWNYAYLIIS